MHAMTQFRDDSGRWTAPALGAGLVALLGIGLAAGVVPAIVDVPLIMGAVLLALVLGTMRRDEGEEDHRADLPLAVAGMGAVVLLLKYGLLLLAVQAVSWAALLIGIGYAVTHEYGWKWIAGGIVAVLALNVVLVVVR